METIIKKLTFGLPLEGEVLKQAQNTEGFVRVIDEEYFEVEYTPTNDHVYFKRNEGEKLVMSWKTKEHDYNIY